MSTTSRKNSPAVDRPMGSNRQLAAGVKIGLASAPHNIPDCWSCLHFTISWDPKMPYSCKAIGFKSKRLPCLEVQGVDGRSCQGFAKKPAT
jgi:hypothetical protein